MKQDIPYVFLSYSTQNKAIADSVKAELECNEISCWMAPLSIPFGSNYSMEIFDAISNCKVFVLILSEQAMNSDYVSKELDLAVSNRKIILPFQIDDKELAKNFAFYLCNVQIIRASHSIQIALEEMSRFIISVCKHVQPSRASEYLPTQQLQFPGNQISYRKEFINRIDEAFSSTNVVCLNGVGGIGKSELARTYIKYKLDREELELVSYNDYKGDLKQTIAQIAFDHFDEEAFLKKYATDDDPGNVTELLYNEKLSMLRKCGRSILLVIDGVDNYDDTELHVLNTLKCRVLLTTRCTFESFSVIRLEDFALEDQRAIFVSYYEDFDPSDDEAQEYIDKIVLLVNKHTLTIVLLALFLNVSGLSVKELYESLAVPSKRNLILDEEVEYDHQYSSVVQHISNIFEMSNLPEDEVKMLYQLSLFPSGGIAKKLYRKWSKEGSMTLVDKLVKKGWVQNSRGRINLHPIVNSMIGARRPVSLAYMKDFLVNFANYLDLPALGSIGERDEAERFAFSVADQITDRSEIACYVLLCCGRYINDYNYWKFYGAKNAYTFTFFNQALNTNDAYVEQLQKAYDYLTRSIEIYHELNLTDLGLLSRAYSNLGNTCFNMNRFEEAAKYHQLALEGRKQDFDNAHEKVMNSRRRLGTCRLWMNQPEQALHSYKENLDAVIASGSEDVLLISKCWFDCGRVYDICGAQSQTLNCYSNAVSYIDQIRKIDCFGCAKLCYEAALVYAKNNVAEKAAHLLAFGEACLQTMDAELADSLLALIKAARSSL